MKKPYPAWVCHDCGTRFGTWYEDGEYLGPSHHNATYHYDTCDVCGMHDVPCTEPRDYGHLRSGWELLCRNSKRNNRSRAATL
jgi:hypothetical protein